VANGGDSCTNQLNNIFFGMIIQQSAKIKDYFMSQALKTGDVPSNTKQKFCSATQKRWAESRFEAALCCLATDQPIYACM